jgi:hypothetical protein
MHIGGIMVSSTPREWQIFGLTPSQVKPKTIKLVFAVTANTIYWIILEF